MNKQEKKAVVNFDLNQVTNWDILNSIVADQVSPLLADIQYRFLKITEDGTITVEVSGLLDEDI